MRTVLFVIPSLEYSGAARQLTLLASGLPRDQFAPRVCVLGRGGPLAETLRAAGVAVEVLDWHRWFDVAPFLHLRRQVRSGAAIVHVWGPTVLRAVGLCAGRTSSRLVVSAPLAPRERHGKQTHQLSWFDRRLLARMDRLVLSGAAEAERCRRLGVDDKKLRVIPPGVVIPDAAAPEATIPETGPPPWGSARTLVCLGPLEPYKGFYDAIWAFDILKYLYDDLHLVLIGTGSDRGRLEQFAVNIRARDRIHFLGPQATTDGLLARAAVVWVPSRAEAGRNAVLEAMAAGRPVVASNLPDLAELVVDGQTGFLVPVGDKVVMARETRRLLDDGPLRQRLGDTGRQHVREHFPAAAMVRRFIELYDTVLGM